MKAYIFPGQGSQRPGMAKELLAFSPYSAQEYLEMADDILGFELSKIMIDGTANELRKTSITQPAVYVYSVIKARISRDFKPDMVAGHSLGEFSALAAVRGVTFAEGLRIVHKRAVAMQAACDAQKSSMAAVLGLDNEIIERICGEITEEIVVPANYNCPGQLVISGTEAGLALAKERLMAGGARRVLPLKVNGAFHSPVMEAAKAELEKVVNSIKFNRPQAMLYQNLTAMPTNDPEEIQKNLIEQLTSPVKWMQTIENMIVDGARQFVEVGSRPVLGNMVKKINSKAAPVLL